MAGGAATPAGGEDSPFTEDQAAAEIDEETVSDTRPGDVVVEDDGTVRLRSDARLEEQRAQAAAAFEEELGRDVDPDNIILRGGGEAELEPDARPGADADGGQGSRTGSAATVGQFDPVASDPDIQASDPNAVAQVIGSAVGTVADSPVGEGIGSAADAVFEGENSPAETIEQTFDPAARYWERQITDQIAASDPPESNVAPTTIGDAADSALVRDSAEQASRFANLPAFGRDLARAGQGANQAGEFLVENEDEAVQLVFDAAERAPGAAAEAAQTAADNPRETARSVAVTGGALAATAGVGGLASAGLRSGTRAASRRAAQSASRVDDALGVRSGGGTARRRLRDVRERAPDVTTRRDPDAPRVEIDPLLQQQIRDAVQNPPSVSGAISRRASTPDFDTPSASGVREGLEDRAGSVRETASRASDVSERIGRRIQEARTRTALRAEVARESGIRGLVGADSAESVARRAGRGLERARIRGRLQARETSAAVREGIGATRPSGLPTGLGSRVSGASERVADLSENIGGSISDPDVSELLPSTLAGGSVPSVDAASVARRAGRQFERARIRGRLRAREGAAATQETLESATDIGDLDIGLSAGSGDLGGSLRRRVDSATGFLSEGTIRIGPARPRRSRTTLDADDIELEPGAFPDDAELPGGSGGGNIDFDADIDAGRGSGGGQIGALRTRRRGRTDTFEESRQVRRNRRGGSRRDSFAFGGALATMGGVSALTGFDESELGTPQSDLPVVSDISLGLTGFSSTMMGTGDEITSSETGINEILAPTTGSGFDYGQSTGSSTFLDSASSSGSSTVTTSPPTTPSDPPLKTPDIPEDPNDEDPFEGLEFDVDDQVFDTGVADPDEVLDRIL
jgi:hypothetical protein